MKKIIATATAVLALGGLGLGLTACGSTAPPPVTHVNVNPHINVNNPQPSTQTVPAVVAPNISPVTMTNDLVGDSVNTGPYTGATISSANCQQGTSDGTWTTAQCSITLSNGVYFADVNVQDNGSTTNWQTVSAGVPPSQSSPTDPWSVTSAYTSDISNGDYSDAWNMLSSSMQNYFRSYDNFVSDFTPIGFDNPSEVSESGDTVTFTYTLHNTNDGTYTPSQSTFTVDGGLITSTVAS